MTIENSDGINILLVSSSKLLKNKFIESISNELNNFTLMTKSIESQIENNRININCFISDYSIELENSKYATKYVQLIDGSDKNIIYSLIENTYSAKKNSQYFIASIIYLYDESNSDTFAYIQSIHNELKSNFENFILSNDLTCLLCNMINVTNLESNQSSSDESFKILNVVQNFLDQFNNIQYISQQFENSILGSVPVVSNSEETNNKLKINFDFIVDRYFSFVPKQESTYIDFNSYSNSLNTTSLKKSISTFKNENFKHNYKGEISNNLRNGMILIKIENTKNLTPLLFEAISELFLSHKSSQENYPVLKNKKLFPFLMIDNCTVYCSIKYTQN
ncbi:hypothetical protein BpHYR1_030481 [Brachionus plicatilis]|uniref:Uncharacterized protein n=1 Tax=Brachionus plicatilis TaxID=10195 RepID=A0A3M7PD35_BRAPC|nr:hypothetical protein BpHYR1_030481 [Brachionus plicatilis]